MVGDKMKRRCLVLLAAAVGGLLSSHAFAQENPDRVSLFAEAGYSRVDFEGNPDIGFNALQARLGLRVGKYVGAEIEAATGLDDKVVTVGGFDVTTKLKSSVAGFGVLSVPVGRGVELLGRAGYASVRISADAGFGSVSDSEGGFAGGVGVRYFPKGGRNGARADYTRYEIEDGKANVFQIGFVHRF